MSLIRSPEVSVLARRWSLLGFAGSVLLAIAATGGGALPVSDVLGGWPRLPGQGQAWPWVPLAFLGMTALVGAWWRLGRELRAEATQVSFVSKTLALWAAPIALAPPLYSRDIYSYLAQGTMFSAGLDPYRVGPYALGSELASNVSPMWQHTPAPYGPAFLALASGVTSVTGQHIVAAVLGMRAVMLAALAVLTVCLVLLARHCGVDPAGAVWLGSLNPLVLAHVASGAHNDALMLALVLVGVLLALKDRPLLASVVLGLAVLVKAPAAVALVVVLPAMARRIRGRWPWLRGGLAVGAAAGGTMLAVTTLTGTWYGWVVALRDTTKVRNGLSISTDLGMLANSLTKALRLESGFDFVPVLRFLAMALAAFLVWVTLARTRGRPVLALALIMGTLVLLGPIVQPWYLLWGIVPLAAATADRRVVLWVSGLSAGLALYLMPSGAGLRTGVGWAVVGVLAGLALLHASRPEPEDGAGGDTFPPDPESAVEELSYLHLRVTARVH